MGFDCDRCSRALSQPMFLLRAKKLSETHWTFLVRGYSGTNYDLNFSSDALECSCPDFQKRKDTCKHVFFIFGRVLADVDLMVDVDSGLAASEVFSPMLCFSERLERRIDHRLERLRSSGCSAVVNGDDDCVVCFEPIKAPEWVCVQCRKPAMHTRCAREWFKYCGRTPSCPLCRAVACEQQRHPARGGEDDGGVFDFLSAA